MAPLQKEKVHGKEYWCIVECRRVNGKPRPLVLEFLGSKVDLIEEIEKRRLRAKG